MNEITGEITWTQIDARRANLSACRDAQAEDLAGRQTRCRFTQIY